MTGDKTMMHFMYSYQTGPPQIMNTLRPAKKGLKIVFIISSGSPLRPRLHEQIKPPLIAQILDPYEVTPGEFGQIKVVLFAHVNAA